jgi:hypothetical protein
MRTKLFGLYYFFVPFVPYCTALRRIITKNAYLGKVIQSQINFPVKDLFSLEKIVVKKIVLVSL